MSSVCPKMSLAELIVAGKANGYEGIEFRPEWNHGHGVELTSSSDQRAQIRRQLSASGLEPCCISPGTKFCHDDAAKRDADLSKLLGYIELARDVGIGRIRVFGDPLPNNGAGRRAANYQLQAEYLTKAAERAAAAEVRLVIET